MSHTNRLGATPCSLGIAALFALCACGDAPPNRPDVLLLVMDTVRRPNLSSYGHVRQTTPRIDRFGRDALVYDNAYAVASWTVPNHASMFTGLYPARHGATHESGRLDDALITLAEILRFEGYDTAAFINNAALAARKGLNQGFDDYVELWRKRVREAALRGVDPPDAEAGAAATQNAVSGWFEEREDPERPWFVVVNYIDPHMPYSPPSRYRESFLGKRPARRRTVHYDYVAFLSGEYAMSKADFRTSETLYDAEIRFLDDQIGQLLDWMRSQGRLDDTLVIVTSDHGEAFGEHGLIGHQFALYDELLRVPLIIRFPGTDAAVGRSSRIVQLHDLFYTILEVTRSHTPETLRPQGESLLQPGRRTEVFAEHYRPLGKLREFEKRFPDFDASPFDRRLRSIASGDWKLIWSSDGSRELYRLSDDPGEQRNRAAAEPERVRTMERQLEDWLHGVRDGRPVPVVVPEATPDPRIPSGSDPRDEELEKALRALGYAS